MPHPDELLRALDILFQPLLAGDRDLDYSLYFSRPCRHDCYPVGKKNRFVDTVGNEKNGLFCFIFDPEKIPLQDLTGLGVKRGSLPLFSCFG